MLQTLTTQFGMNQWIADRNFDGLSHADSLTRALPGGNTLNWLAGHIVATRCAVLPALQRESPWGDREKQMYRRTSEALPDADLLPFEEIVRIFSQTTELILSGLAELSAEGFAAPAPFSPGGQPVTVAGLLAKIAIHEGYHLGQIGVLRRVAGKEGAIKS